MTKFCVFCGSKPEGKTKEHVIPRWLIEMTGNPKRQATFGFYSAGSEIKERVHSFDQFTFPACDSCNNEFSDLEGSVKPIIEKILLCCEITAEELSLTMDWLDKVRVGIWLGRVTLDRSQDQANSIVNVTPKFHIKNRIGLYDRVLIIEKFVSSQKKLCIGGAESFSFLVTPSAFTMTINNFCLTNISSVFLVSRRVGFPYPSHSFLEPDRDEIGFNITLGRSRVTNPIIRKRIKESGQIFLQPMFPYTLGVKRPTEYNSKYVSNHSMNYEKGKGNIFEQRAGNHIEYSKNDIIQINPSPVYYEREFAIRSIINIYEWQNWIKVLYKPDTKSLTDNQRRFIRERFGLGEKYNKKLIDHYESMLAKLTRPPKLAYKSKPKT